ncbi:MAG: hypothetical protein ACSLE6_09290, partial [Mycobacterium sp.]
DTKNWHQKTNHPSKTGRRGVPPQGWPQQTKTTKHTIEFSNNRLAIPQTRTEDPQLESRGQ